VTNDYRTPVAEQAPTQILVGAVIDHCAAAGVPLSKRTIGQLSRSTKSLLDDGFPEDLVAEGMMMAVATNEPFRHDSYCQGIALARTGLLVGRRDADRKLRDEAEIASRRRRL
jgi:hypothetical protein